MTCPLCVQWRCAECKSNEWPNCCEKAYEVSAEPYWPDGSVAVITQQEYCESCQQALAEYEANKEPG